MTATNYIRISVASFARILGLKPKFNNERGNFISVIDKIKNYATEKELNIAPIIQRNEHHKIKLKNYKEELHKTLH